MMRQTQLVEYFVHVADTLLEDFDLVDLLHDLTVNAALVSGAASAGLVLLDHQDRVRYMAASNEEGRLLELFQIQNGDGPCLDAIRGGRPVVNADLGEAADRWPQFAPAARAAGFQSVHAFPLRLGGQTMGALNIFGAEHSRFDPEEVRLVQGLADIATIAIVQERSRHPVEIVTEQLQTALNSRIVIEQAKGALARSESITPAQAFEVLRETARHTHQKISDVARSVIVDLARPMRARPLPRRSPDGGR